MNFFYNYIFIIKVEDSFDKDVLEGWDESLQLETNYPINVDDVIRFDDYEMMQDEFKTTHFKVLKRLLIHNSDSRTTEDIFVLTITPDFSYEKKDNLEVDYREIFYEQSISKTSLSVKVLNRLVPFFWEKNINSRNWKVKHLINFDLHEFSKIRGNGTGATYNELKRFLDDYKIPYKS